MTERILRARQLKAVRLVRAGSAIDHVARALRLPLDSLEELQRACRDVPDDFLARLEHALSANEKLRRLVAGLGNPVRDDG